MQISFWEQPRRSYSVRIWNQRKQAVSCVNHVCPVRTFHHLLRQWNPSCGHLETQMFQSNRLFEFFIFLHESAQCYLLQLARVITAALIAVPDKNQLSRLAPTACQQPRRDSSVCSDLVCLFHRHFLMMNPLKVRTSSSKSGERGGQKFGPPPLEPIHISGKLLFS